MATSLQRRVSRLKKESRIVVIAPGEPVEYFGLLWEGIKSASSEVSSLGVRVEWLPTPCHDVTRQRELLTHLLQSVPEAIAMVPAHPTALDNLIGEHVRQGTKVISFNADAPRSKRSSYVGPDAAKSGALAAEVLSKLMGPKGGIVSFPGPQETGNLAVRYSGFLDELAKWRPDARIIACYEGLDNIREKTVRLLAQCRDAGGIYVGNSRAYEIGAALESIDTRIPCVGFDNTGAVRRFLEKNFVSAVVDQNTYQQGYLAVQRAYESVSARRRVSRSTLIPATVVFASNASDTTNTDTLNEAFELLVRRRTARLRSYQRMLEEANHRLLHLAETDELTGLLNRRKIQQLLTDELAQCSTQSPLSILMIDVNEFKHYNDSFGHHTGDEALRLLARALIGHTRTEDCCGRIGGDEFCILLPNTDEAVAAHMRERLYRAVADVALPSQSGDLSVRVSIGCATAPKQGITAQDLLRAADQDMYAEKYRDAAAHGDREFARVAGRLM